HIDVLPGCCHLVLSLPLLRARPGRRIAHMIAVPFDPAENRAREGDRLEWLFERRCDWLRRQGRGRHLAVDAMDGTLSYLGLDARANQLARFLVREGVRPGDRIGLLSDRAVDGYLGMLAVLKARAAYVPLDPSYPPDRLSYITS